MAQPVPQLRPVGSHHWDSSTRAQRHIEEALDFTKHLIKQFSAGDPNEIPAIHSLIKEIRSHVDKLHVCQERYLPGISEDPEIDDIGTKLWNVCTRLKRDYLFSSIATPATSAVFGGRVQLDGDGDTAMVAIPGTGVINLVDEDTESVSRSGVATPASSSAAGGNDQNQKERVKRMIVHGRVLALYLLVIAKKPSPKENNKTIRACRELIRLMKLVLKAGKDCIDLVSSTPTTTPAAPTGVTAGGNSKGKGVASKHDDENAEKEQDTKLATMVMEVAASCKGDLQDFNYTSYYGKHGKDKGQKSISLVEDEINECNCLEVEYFILRTALSWVDQRLDVAEHMYTKAQRLHKFLTPSYAEKLADVLHEIGKSLAKARDFTMGIKWLERANDILNTQRLENLSREGVKLRLAIIQALVTALLAMNTQQGLEKARNLVDYVESQLGSTKMIVSLLRLEVLRKSPPETFDDETYSEVLLRMIRNVELKDSTLKLLTHHLQKLHQKKAVAACAVMDELIRRFREIDGDQDWLEKLIIQRLWFDRLQVTQQTTSNVDAFVNMLKTLTRPFSPKGCLTTHGLMWAQLFQSHERGDYEVAEKWGHAMLLPIFAQLGNKNRPAIDRKLLLCTTARNDMTAALWVIRKISDENTWENQPMTAYLAFKVAVQVKDRELAEKCMEIISQNKDYIDFLGACISESQRLEDIQTTISGLKRLHQKYERKSFAGKVHLPALFRCAIRLLNRLLEGPMDFDDREARVVELCLEFESVVAAVKQHDYTFVENREPDSPLNLFTVEELEWFSRNAYNIALNHTKDWDMRCIIRLLNSCIEIINYFPADYHREHMVDLHLKMLFSRFIISSALVSLARLQDRVEPQKKDYRELRVYVAEFDHTLVELLNGSERHATMMNRNRAGPSHGQQHQPEGSQQNGCLDHQSKLDMGRKLATLLVFDFEAAIALEQWDDLGVIVAKVKGIDREGEKKANLVVPFQAMADCLLRAATEGVGIVTTGLGGIGGLRGSTGGARLTGQVLYSTMRKLVNEIWLVETFDAVKLAKYTRCLFQATLPLDDMLAFNLLDEACQKARQLQENKTNANYWPEEELDWLAGTSFNHAIDHYAARKLDKARMWALKAMEMAHLCRGGAPVSSLERAMQAKYAAMKLDCRA